LLDGKSKSGSSSSFDQLLLLYKYWYRNITSDITRAILKENISGISVLRRAKSVTVPPTVAPTSPLIKAGRTSGFKNSTIIVRAAEPLTPRKFFTSFFQSTNFSPPIIIIP